MIRKKSEDISFQGDLYIKFSGDPKLTKIHLKSLVQKLRARGIKKISGHVFIDPTRFSGKTLGPGWMWDDQQSCYSAPLSAVILNRNCSAFTIETPRKRMRAKIKNNMQLHIRNNLKRCPSSQISCLHQIHVSKDNLYYFSGAIAPGKHTLELAVKNPEYYAVQYIQTLFRSHQIQISKQIQIRSLPKKYSLQIVHHSPPLKNLIKTMLKDSDNLIADSLLKTIGAEYFHTPGNWRNGSKALKKIMNQKLNVDLNASMIVDGAGLSRYNLIRPTQLVQLLASMHRYPRQLRILKNSLSIAGKDGTLKYRFKHSNATIYAKTGSMNGITALAGYIQTHQKDWLSFAILINGIVGKTTQYKALEEALCQYFSSL